MEDVPTTTVSIGEGEEHESMNMLSDELAFAVGEDDSGLNFAYIIHLPDVYVNEQIVDGNPQDSLNVETKFTPDMFPGVHYTEMPNTELVLPVSSGNSCDNLIGMTPLLPDAGSVDPVSPGASILANTPVGVEDSSDPVQIQYLEDGVFVHDGEKCDVKNGLFMVHPELHTANDDVNVKCDPLALNASGSEVDNICGSFNKASDQCNISSGLDDNVVVKKEESLEECDTTKDISNLNGTLLSLDTKPKTEPTVATLATTQPSNNPKVLVKDGVVYKAVRTYRSSKTYPIRTALPIIVKNPPRVSIPIPRKKRRLIIDAQKQIPISEFKQQLQNTKDIVHERSESAPGTKQAMRCLELGGVVHLFSSPGRPILNVRLSRLFTNHLVVLTQNDNCRPEPTVFTPLDADLRIPTSSVNMGCDDLTVNCQAGGSPSKRLTNSGKPLVCQFKGLKKPPVFKEYKRLQRKAPKPNGIANKTSQFSHKPISNNSTCTSTSLEEESTCTTDTATIKIEEVVYTVEDGESLVLKSRGIKEASSQNAIQDSTSADDLILVTSVNENPIEESIEEIHYDERILSSGDIDEIKPSIDDVQFPASPISDEFYNGSSPLDVDMKNETKSVNLHSEDDLKLWNYEVSSS